MALVPGDRLGPYQVESLLGAGGMGEVYRGHDTRLGRKVALKVISQRLVGDDTGRRRFETEARAASALNHPAIVTIYDIGESDGMSWIAMELIEGRTLRDRLATGRLPIRRTWSIACQLADGLAAAHAKGIVHRDLKPENVMESDEGRVKILDFGLARQNVAGLLDGASTVTIPGSGSGTQAGVILGTVGYMSPEQATGRTVDFRSDQFSFGAVVYELLTGRHAFDRPSAVETLSAIIRDDPPQLTATRRDVSDAFARVIDRCLEKLPERRFESTRELATALDALTPQSTTESTAVVATDVLVDERRAPKPAPRPAPRALGLAISAALVLAAAAAGAFLWNRSDSVGPPTISSVAVLPFANTAQDPEIDYLGEGLTDGVIDHLSRVKSLRVMARATVMRFKGQNDPQHVARALGVGAVVSGSVGRRGDQIVISTELIHGTTGERLWGQTFDRPLADLMQVQDAIVSSIADGLRLRLSGEEKARLAGSGTDNAEAYELVLRGRFLLHSDTEEDDLAALKLFEQAAEKDPNFVGAHLGIGTVYARRAGNGYDSPRVALPHARKALEKAAALDPNDLSVRIQATHIRFQTTRNWAAAEREYRSFINDPDVGRAAPAIHPVSLFLVAAGKPDDAVEVIERALVDDPGNLESRVMLGNYLLHAGRLDEALRVYDAIAVEAPDDPRPLLGAADVLKRRGEFARASEARRKAHELAGDAAAARAFQRAATEADYAKAEVAVARQQLSYLEELAQHRYVSEFDLARLHAQIGNREQALTRLERSLEDDSVGLLLLKVDPAWDSVRAEPRFAAVVRRIGIP